LRNKYGFLKACEIMPVTYVFPNDFKLFKLNYNPNYHYVLKTGLQRQQGIKLSNDYNTILSCKKNKECLVVQEYLKNSLTFKGHKINFRIFFLVVCNGKNIYSYTYDDGILSFSKTKNNDSIIDFDNSIASSYTSKSLYSAGFPRQFNNLKGVPIDKLKHDFNNKLGLLTIALKNKICTKCVENTKFELFGADFFVDKDLKTKLIEINITPGMFIIDKNDRKLRYNLYKDILKIVGLAKKDEKNGFTLIYP
jgi:hypothetical protein